MNVLLGEEGYGDLVSFLALIHQTCWDYVPPSQNERPGVAFSRRGRRASFVDRSTGGRGGGLDYLYLNLVTGEGVDGWDAKRCRSGMYDGDTPWPRECAYNEQGPGAPQTLREVHKSAAEELPDYEEVAARIERMDALREEVMEISDDDSDVVRSGPVICSVGRDMSATPEAGGPAVPPMADEEASGSDGESIGTLELDARGNGPSSRSDIVFTHEGEEII